MSDIPRAKAIIDRLIDQLLAADITSEQWPEFCAALCSARLLLDRERPDFIVRNVNGPVTKAQARRVLRLRRAGWSMQKIAEHLAMQMGRVSEVINGKRKGV